jgi:hypothetical protein
VVSEAEPVFSTLPWAAIELAEIDESWVALLPLNGGTTAVAEKGEKSGALCGSDWLEVD